MTMYGNVNQFCIFGPLSAILKTHKILSNEAFDLLYIVDPVSPDPFFL
jgi:hypothetical protein